jgi:branched-chain amino acid transport system permease protein
MTSRIKDALITALIAAILALPLAGIRTEDGVNGMVIEWRFAAVAIASALVFIGRLSWGFAREGHPLALLAVPIGLAAPFVSFPTVFLKTAAIGMAVVITARFIYEKIIKVPVKTSLIPSFKILFSLSAVSYLLILLAIVFPFTPIATRYVLDVAIMVLTYIMLAWGLNITVGYAGLLDLGYAGFYALGAYCYALMAQHFNIGFRCSRSTSTR